MIKTFMMKLNEIQPSQLYISSEKLYNVKVSVLLEGTGGFD